MSLLDDLIGVLAKEAGVPPPVAELGLQIAKLAVAHNDDPESYLRTMLASIEADAQALAKAKWG